MSLNTEVKILGKTYAVRSDLDQRFMSETTTFLNEKVREIESRAGVLSTEKVAVLTAMNLAGQLLREKKESLQLRKELLEKTRKLLKLIDAEL